MEKTLLLSKSKDGASSKSDNGNAAATKNPDSTEPDGMKTKRLTKQKKKT